MCPWCVSASSVAIRPEVPQETLRLGQKIPHEIHVLQVVERPHVHRAFIEAVDRGPGDRHEDRRMGGDEELRSIVHTVLDHGQKGELALRRQGSLRLIQEVETPGHQSRLEELQKALSMGVRIQVLAVAALHLTQRAVADSFGLRETFYVRFGDGFVWLV